MKSLFLLLLYVISASSLGCPGRRALGAAAGRQPHPAKPRSPALSAKEKPTKTYEIPLPPRPDFAAVEWLVGEWKGQTTGRGPERKVRLSVAFALDKRFMIFHEELSLPPSKAAPASSESWMGILSANRGDTGFDLRVFSSTGFITRYRVTVEGPEIQFNPEGGDQPPPGWLFRRVVQRLNLGELSETVQVAPPNKSFFEYYAAKLNYVPPSAESSRATPPANR